MNKRREIWQFYANCLKGSFLALNLLAINIMTMDYCPLTALANIVQIITIIHIATAVSVCTIRALAKSAEKTHKQFGKAQRIIHLVESRPIHKSNKASAHHTRSMVRWWFGGGGEMFNNCVINKLLNSIAAAVVVAMLTKSLCSFMLSSRLMSGKKLLHIHHFFINLITRLFFCFYETYFLTLTHSQVSKSPVSQELINFSCFCCCRFFLLLKNYFHRCMMWVERRSWII